MTDIAYTPNKLVAIFGGGRTGKSIAIKLAEMDYQVDIFDLQKVDPIEHHNVKTYQISKDNQETVDKLKLALQARGGLSYQSIFHNFLYSAEDFETFMKTVENFSNHFGTIGTILTYQRNQKTEIISEQTPKPRISEISNYGGYSKGKYQLELAIKNYQLENQTKKYFLPKTFHIVGAGWLPGICPPYFRDYRIIAKIRTGILELPFAGQTQYQLIDNNDLATRIAWGIHLQLNGEYNIVNPEVITAKEYYQMIASIMNLKLEIIDLPIEEISETKIMLLDWLTDCSKIQQSIPAEHSFESYHGSLTKSMIHLQQELAKKPSLITARSDIWQKMNYGKMPSISHLI